MFNTKLYFQNSLCLQNCGLLQEFRPLLQLNGVFLTADNIVNIARYTCVNGTMKIDNIFQSDITMEKYYDDLQRLIVVRILN